MDNKMPTNGVALHSGREAGCYGWVSVFSDCQVSEAAAHERSAEAARVISTDQANGAILGLPFSR